MSTYIDTPALGHAKLPEGHDWPRFTRQRLAWLYGADHDLTRRAMTTADVAAWNRLGNREAA